MQAAKHTLYNDHLKVILLTKGAELASIQAADIEYIWQADSSIWGRHSPILFPIVGRLVDHEYDYLGQTYTMGQHGFARDAHFEVVHKTSSSIIFQLQANKNTKASYPFDFVLQISYTLQEKSIQVAYDVKNPSKKKSLYFSIGAHPAFSCPFEKGQKRSDFSLIFDKKIAPPVLIHDDGLYKGKTIQAMKPGVMKLTDDIFNDDSLTFSPNPFSKVTFRHLPSQKDYLSISFPNFPYLAIWSKKNVPPYVCIEPWYGIADSADHNKDFTKKEGIIQLDPIQNFHAFYDIDILV